MHRDVLVGRYQALYRDRFHIGLVQQEDHLTLCLDADAIHHAELLVDPHTDYQWAPLKDLPINQPFAGQAPVWHQFRAILNLFMNFYQADSNGSYSQLVSSNTVGKGYLLVSIPRRTDATFDVQRDIHTLPEHFANNATWVEYARHAYGDGHNDTINLRVAAQALTDASKRVALEALLRGCWQDVHGAELTPPLTTSDLIALATEAAGKQVLFVIHKGRPDELITRFSETAYTIGEYHDNGDLKLRDVNPSLGEWKSINAQCRLLGDAFRAENAGRTLSKEMIHQAINERLVLPDLDSLLPLAK